MHSFEGRCRIQEVDIVIARTMLGRASAVALSLALSQVTVPLAEGVTRAQLQTLVAPAPEQRQGPHRAVFHCVIPPLRVLRNRPTGVANAVIRDISIQ